MRLAIDAMGTDLGHAPIVSGVATFLKEFTDTTVLIVGKRELLEDALAKADLGAASSRVEIVHASEVVAMDEKLSDLKRKKDSSILRLAEAVKEGRADGMVALGNTVASVAAATLRLRHIPGIMRAGLAVPMPSGANGVCVALDMGANVNAKPKHLLGYGVMASIYSNKILHVDNPRVGLLNVGEERGKGNEFINETFALLDNAPINFIGNVEGCDIWNGHADVVVCDGFVGNAMLKCSEGLARAVLEWLRHGMMQNWFTKLCGAMAKPLMKAGKDYAKKRGNPSTYGGVPLLGVNGVCCIGHGASNETGVYNALRAAHEGVSVSMVKLIRETMESFGEPDAPEDTGEAGA